jgi:hypothetical protein
MPAQIIEFPHKKKVSYKPSEHKNVDLVHAWNFKFFNPYLNSIYSESVPHVERWYLEIRHCMNSEVKSNLVQLLIHDKPFCLEFMDACASDIVICQSVITNPEYEISAVYWIKKLKRWQSSFLACHRI